MEIQEIPVNRISPSPFQPRETFDKEEIQELADSIKEFDLLNPILIKPIGNDNYQIIAGERRWRAAQFAKLKTIAAIVKDIDDRRQRIESLIENVHRKDLDIIEKGRGILEIFRSHGIRKSPKRIANQIQRIIKKERKSIISENQDILEICQKIKKPLPTLRRWLDTISVDEEIIQQQLSKPTEDRISEVTLARLSSIENRDLQKKTYAKITEQDMGAFKASKFISTIKKIPEEEREAILTSSVPVEIIGDRTEGYSIEIPEEHIEELRRAVKMGEQESAAILAEPIVQQRGQHRRNWQAHLEILSVLNSLSCPYCEKPGSSHLRWICHEDKSIEEAKDRAGENWEKLTKTKELKPKPLGKKK